MVDTSARRATTEKPVAPGPPRRARADVLVVGFTLLLGLVETLSSGLGWPALRAVVAVVFAWLLLQRRRAPLVVLVAMAVINTAANIALRIADHWVLLTGLSVVVAIYGLVRRTSGRHLVVGLGVVAGHAVGVLLVDPNSGARAVLLLHLAPVLLAYAVTTQRALLRSTSVRTTAIAVLLVALFAATQGSFAADQLSSYATRTRSPAMAAEWMVEGSVLRAAAEASGGTHTADGAVHHTVDYPHQLLAALTSPTASVEADVTVIDGTAFLQHDPRDAVGMPLLEFLEYAAIAEFPIVKLDLKRDRIGPIIEDAERAIERFGLDPRHLQFNANVFRGPGVENDVFGARSDKSFTDRMYNLVVMELETSDLVRIARRFPETTIVISSTTPTGPLEEGYSERHVERFIRAANEVRRANPDQPLAFAVRGDLAAQSGPHLLGGLTAIEDSYVAAWWSSNPRPTTEEIEALRAGGVTFFDLGEDGGN